MIVLEIIAAILAIGWITNLVRFLRTSPNMTKFEKVVRGIGVVIFPIGGIIGFM